MRTQDWRSFSERMENNFARTRGVGEVTAFIEPRANINIGLEKTIEIDLFVRKFGFSSLGDKWRPVDLNEANDIAVWLLTHDMAYESELVELKTAVDIMGQFLDCFSSNACFYSNVLCMLPGTKTQRLSKWNAISKSTFDAGIVILDNNLIGILWFEDED